MREINVVRHKTNIGTFILGALGGRLCYVGLPGDGKEKGLVSFCKKWHLKPVEYKEGILNKTAAQLDEYLTKQREYFDIPLEFFGTHFQVSVWKGFLKIPYGRTKTYGEIAAAIGKPTAPRAVGSAAHSNPLAIVVPCHRIIGKDGSLVGFGGGLNMKRHLLLLEGAIE